MGDCTDWNFNAPTSQREFPTKHKRQPCHCEKFRPLAPSSIPDSSPRVSGCVCYLGVLSLFAGCEVCDCNPPPCPDFACYMNCEHGFKADENGCYICEYRYESRIMVMVSKSRFVPRIRSLTPGTCVLPLLPQKASIFFGFPKDVENRSKNRLEPRAWLLGSLQNTL